MSDESIKTERNISQFADEDLIVDKDYQPSWFRRFLLKQAGGFDSKYYTQSEAKSASFYAVLKFGSVTFATLAFMKAIYSIFSAEVIQNLPDFFGISAESLIAVFAACGIWWIISTLDTSVIHAMRSSKAAEEAYQEYKIGTESSLRMSLSSLFLRIGVSVGGLIITIPAILVFVSQNTTDQYLKREVYEPHNNEIIEEYKGRLDAFDEGLLALKQSRDSAQKKLTELKIENASVTVAQKSSLENLSSRLSVISTQKTKEENSLREQERKRDLADDRIRQEREGIRGSLAGCRPEVPRAPNCDAAMADRDLAKKQIATIRIAIGRYDNEIAVINKQIDAINAAILQQGKDLITNVEKERASLIQQIRNLDKTISVEEKTRERISDVNKAATDDLRFKHFNPDLSERFAGYLQYMQKEANLIEWGTALGFVMMIICIELGVFVAAATVDANAGEVRAYMGRIARMDQAADLFREARERQNLENELNESSYAEIRQKLEIAQLKDEIFQKALEKVRNDPALVEEAIDHIIATLNVSNSNESQKDELEQEKQAA